MNVHSLSIDLFIIVKPYPQGPSINAEPTVVEPCARRADRCIVRPTPDLPNPAQTVLRELSATDRYLVGVSGGRDSVALLDWLLEAGYRNVVVCHLNHQLRGRASAADARFVNRLADKLHLDVVVDSVDVNALAIRKKLSIETAARLARYGFFAQAARRKRCRTLLLAHHADDLVETFLINLFRGAGSSGLRGIRETSEQSVGKTSLSVIRPFLRVWRSDIERYIHNHQLSFREDASNTDMGPLRNRLRLKVIPFLEKTVGREIRKNIWRTAMIMAEEEHLFSQLIPNHKPMSDEMPLHPLREMEVALQRRSLHQWLRAAGAADVGFDAVERVRALLSVSSAPARTNLPRDRHVRRRAGKLIFE
jgi:tRNA(Ile)-lysidine synthase